jgi:Tfp pilus assembly protein PilF
VDAFQKGQYERAQSRLERAVKLAGDVKEMSPAYNLLGMARYRLKDLDAARTAFEESRRLDHAYAPRGLQPRHPQRGAGSHAPTRQHSSRTPTACSAATRAR